jgi:hypothetical protein
MYQCHLIYIYINGFLKNFVFYNFKNVGILNLSLMAKTVVTGIKLPKGVSMEETPNGFKLVSPCNAKLLKELSAPRTMETTGTVYRMGTFEIMDGSEKGNVISGIVYETNVLKGMSIGTTYLASFDHSCNAKGQLIDREGNIITDFSTVSPILTVSALVQAGRATAGVFGLLDSDTDDSDLGVE